MWSLVVMGDLNEERIEGRSSQVCIRFMEKELMLELFGNKRMPRLRSWDRRECAKMTSVV